MPRTCSVCGFNFDKYGSSPGSDVHRCLNGKVTGSRRPTRLEAEKIAKGEMSPADLLPKEKPAAAQSLGRLAPRPAGVPAHQARQPSLEPTNRDIMAGIDKLTTAFEALQTVLLSKRTDA